MAWTPCHLFSSGHDITRSDSHLREILDEFEKAAGGPPAFFHLNDSDGGLGSNKDRHVLIGEGRIGKEPFGGFYRMSGPGTFPLFWRRRSRITVSPMTILHRTPTT
jgi:endonuclease IV